MEHTRIAVIGGGAAGLIFCNLLGQYEDVTLIERGERLGKKLSATGNGQGNFSNAKVAATPYFSQSDGSTAKRIEELITRFDGKSFRAFFEGLGVPSIEDERGRVYPAGRQASALTDALRFGLEEKGVRVRLSTQVIAIKRQGEGFVLTCLREGKKELLYAQTVLLSVGGKAAKQFGTDGSGYALATALGHSVTSLYPSLVQLKTDTAHTKGLKGIRVADGGLSAELNGKRYAVTGDILFTDYGVSGDAVFQLSAYLCGADLEKTTLFIDFLPVYTEGEIFTLLREKQARMPRLANGELLFGVVNNQIGRAILRRAEGDLRRAATLVKKFPLAVTGSLGFDYAQVTKGGIPLREVTDGLESAFVKGLYFAGEVLDADGACGGFNMQWAYASACAVAESIVKGGGQV